MPRRAPSPPTVAVVGATGYIGRAVCDRLSQAGATVRALARPRAAGAEPLSAGQFSAIDVAVERSLPEAFRGARAVINLAGVSNANRDAVFDRVNVVGARNVAAAAREAGVERVIHISHLAAQGPSLNGAVPGEAGREAPMDAHGRSRLQGERAVQAELAERPLCILRPAWVVGEDDPRLARLARAVRAGIAPVLPGVSLSIVARDDLVDLVARLALGSAPLAVGPFFVSADPPISMGALIDLIERNTQGPPALRLKLQPRWLRRVAPVLDTVSGALGVGRGAGQWVRSWGAGSWVCASDQARSVLGFEPRQDVIRCLSDAVRSLAP